MARGGISARLVEAIEVLAGFRGNRLDAAVRRRDLKPYENMIDTNHRIVLNRVDETEEELNDAEDRLRDVEIELTQLGEDLDAAEIDIDQARLDIQEAATAAQGVRNDHDALTAGFADTLADAFDRRDQTLSEARDDITTARDDISRVRGDFDVLTDGFAGTISGALSDRDDAIAAADQKIDAQSQRLDHRIDLQTPVIRDTEQALDEIAQSITRLASVSHEVGSRVADAGIYVDSETGEVRMYALEQIEGRTNTVETRMDAAEANINLRATTTYVDNQIATAVIDPSQIPVFDDLEARISTAEVDIDGLNGAVSLKADTTLVNGMNVRLTEAEVKVDSLEGEISLKVDRTEFDEAETRITSAEQTLGTIDGASITQNVIDLRRVTERVDDAEQQTLGDLLTFYEGRRTLQQELAFVSTEIRARVSETGEALATATTALGAQIEDNAALIVEERTARADADSAMASEITTLSAAVDGVSATLTQDYYTSADADEAIAHAQQELRAEIEDPEGNSIGATLATSYYTIADTDQAIATASQELEARMEQADSDITATLTQDYYTRATVDSALSSMRNELEAEIEQSDSAIRGTLTQDYYTSVEADQAISRATQELQTAIEDPAGSSIGATLVTDYYTITQADQAISRATQDLRAAIENPNGDSLGATLSSDYYTITQTDQAISGMLEEFESTFFTPSGQVRATALSDYYTISQADQAITRRVDELETEILTPAGQVRGSVLSDYYTISQTDQAVAGKIEEFEAELLTPQGQVRGTILSDYYTIAQADTAMTGKIEEFEATILDPSTGQVRATVLNDYLTETQTDQAIAAREEVLTATIQRIEDMTNSSGYALAFNALATVVEGSASDVTLSGPAFGEEATLTVREPSAGRDTSGTTNGARFIVPQATAATLTGRRAKIAILAREAGSNPASSFSVAYSTNSVGNSGAMSSGQISANWEWYSFYYDVPTGNTSSDDYVAIFGDDSKSGKGIEVARAIVGLSTELEDIPDISELSGQIEDIMGLDVGPNSAFGQWVQNIGVNVTDPNDPNRTLSARTALNASAVADIEGNLSSVVGFRAQAGGAVSLLDLVCIKEGAAASKKLTADERAAMEEAHNRGTVDKTQAHDIASVAETGVEYSGTREKVMKKASYLFHKAEVANRETTFLASYRVARKRGLPHAEAIDKAASLTWKIHFDYQHSSRPRFMQGDAMRVLTIFRQFTVNMLYRMARDMHQSVKGATPEERTEARAQLAGITLSMAAHAGITGVWGYGLVMSVLGMILPGMDDDDVEEWVQDALLLEGDSMGTAAWNYAMGMALKGVPGHVTGVNLTDRLGMANLWFRAPYKDLEAEDSVQHYMNELLGPLPSIAFSVGRGVGYMLEGDVLRGVETATPKAVNDLLQAGRYAVNGVTTRRGDPVLEDVGMKDVIVQAFGFTPAAVSEAYDKAGRMKQLEQRIKDKRSRLQQRAGDAILKGKPISEKLMRQIREFNAAHPTYPISKKTLKQSVRGRLRYSNGFDAGANINPKLRPMIEESLAPRLY